jgi:hypothetical protein
MVTALVGLIAFAAALANVLLVSALLAPYADRLDAGGGHLGVWLALGASLLVCLVVPLLLGRSVIGRLRDLKREPRTGSTIAGSLFAWNVLVAGLVWLAAPQPLPRFFVERGNWLTTRLWSLRAPQPPKKTQVPPAAPTVKAPPSEDTAAIAEARATLVRFLKATRTLELEPEMSNESAAAMGARWLKLMHAMYASLWSDDPELSSQFDELFDTWEITPAMLAQPAKLKEKLAGEGRAFLDDVNEIYVALSTISKNPADAPDNVGLGVRLTKSCHGATFDFSALDKLEAKRRSPTEITLGPIPLYFEDGLWRVHLAPFETLYALPMMGHGLGIF